MDSQDDGKKIGIQVARDAVRAARKLEGIKGAYVMPPFGRIRLALEVLELD